MRKYHNELRTIALEKYKPKSHEQRMIVELFGDIVMPSETSAKITHPYTDNDHHRQGQQLCHNTRHGLLSQTFSLMNDTRRMAKPSVIPPGILLF